MSQPETRRRRPPVSCTLCRKRKIRCDKKLPCNNCLHSKTGHCVYVNTNPLEGRPADTDSQSPATRTRHERHVEARPASGPVQSSYQTPSTLSGPQSRPSAPLSAPSTAPSLADPVRLEIDALRARIQELESRLSQPTPPQTKPATGPESNIETLSTGLTGAFHVEHDSPVFGQMHMNSRGLIHKSRHFGQSHWATCIFPTFRDVATAIEPHVRDESSETVYKMAKCKALSRRIKNNRRPEWPARFESDLPSKDVADELVDGYLRTIETLYRILHVPTFKRDYDSLWLSGSQPDTLFLVKVKLILALGAISYDKRFSMRTAATHWVYEAQSWISAPRFKSRICLDFLQIHILLHLGREMIINNSEANWITAGSLVRIAIFMGLHRDPDRFPNQSAYTREMRRRLWNTVLELSLQASISSGSPHLMSLSDFDTRPPGNFDDEQLATQDPVPKPDGEFTHTTLSRALRKTYPFRLAVVRYLNDVDSRNSYGETLRLDKELRAAYKTFCRTLQTFHSPATSGTGTPPFAFRAADFILHRYMSSLHTPFLDQSRVDASCAFSRKAAVDSALRIWYAACPLSATVGYRSDAALAKDGEDDLERLIRGGHGFFRTVSAQAHIIICLELQSQLLEDDGLAPTPLRQDLLTVLRDGPLWLEQCMAAGETNPKAYLLLSLIHARIQSLRQGISKEELPRVLIQAAEAAGDKCLGMLEDMAGQTQLEGMEDDLDLDLDVTWVLGDMPGGFMNEVDLLMAGHSSESWNGYEY